MGVLGASSLNERHRVPGSDVSPIKEGSPSAVLDIPLQAMRSAIRLYDWYMLEHQRLFVSPGAFSGKSKVVENDRFVYSNRIDNYAQRLSGWIFENYEALKQEQRNACVRINNATLQQARRSVDIMKDRHMAMDRLAQVMPLHYRVNFWETGRGKIVCYTPAQKGGFCFGCSQTSGQLSVQCRSDQSNSAVVRQSGNMSDNRGHQSGREQPNANRAVSVSVADAQPGAEHDSHFQPRPAHATDCPQSQPEREQGSNDKSAATLAYLTEEAVRLLSD